MNLAPAFDYLRKSKLQVSDIAILLAAFLGAAHLLIRTSNYGPELNHDSWTYISVAENIAAGDGLKDWLQRAHVSSGPLYPLLVASFGVLGFDPVSIGRFLNIIGFGLIILITGYQLRHHIRHSFLAVIGSVAVMTSYGMTEFSSHLMTETSYILFSLLALVQMWTFLESDNHRVAPLVLSAVFTSLAMATRYIGISLIITGVILILSEKKFVLRYRLKYIMLYSSIPITLFGIWLTRNWLLVETLTRDDTKFESQLLDYIKAYSDIFVSHTLMLHLGFDWLIYLSVTLIILVIWKEKGKHKYQSESFEAQRRQGYATLFALYGLYTLIYVATLVAVSYRIDHADMLDPRFLTPIYVPIIIIVLVLLDLLLKVALKNSDAIPWITICILLTGILSSINLSIRRNIDYTTRNLQLNAKPYLFESYGYSYNMDILIYLRNNPLDGPIYSNGLHILYWLTDVPLGGIIIDDRGSASCLTWVRSLTRSSDPSYITYFTSGIERIDFVEEQFNACNIPELESDPNIQNYMKRIVEKYDGIVYRVTAPPGPRPDFEVTMNANILTYTKNPCSPADFETSYFFLHVIPVDKNTLPSHRSQSGFDNLDFNFEDHGVILNEECRITVELPRYDISHIRTGQYTNEKGEIWEAELWIR